MSLEWCIFLALWAWGLIGILRGAGRASMQIGIVRLAGLDHPPKDFQQTLA